MVLLISSLPLFNWFLFKLTNSTLRKMFFKLDDTKKKKVIKYQSTKAM